MLLALAYIAALGVALVFVSCAAKLNEEKNTLVPASNLRPGQWIQHRIVGMVQIANISTTGFGTRVAQCCGIAAGNTIHLHFDADEKVLVINNNS